MGAFSSVAFSQNAFSVNAFFFDGDAPTGYWASGLSRRSNGRGLSYQTRLEDGSPVNSLAKNKTNSITEWWWVDD